MKRDEKIDEKFLQAMSKSARQALLQLFFTMKSFHQLVMHLRCGLRKN